MCEFRIGTRQHREGSDPRTARLRCSSKSSLRMTEPSMVTQRMAITKNTKLWVAILLPVGALGVAQDRQPVDLIVTHGIVVTMDGGRAIYSDASVAVRGDSIVAVGPRADVESRCKAEQVIDAHGGLVLPGFVNGHTHVPMTLFRGLHD